ncbi:aminotransferase class V-fold PLP-dependent enzyme [Endothiovibrio diazotrophicus]
MSVWRVFLDADAESLVFVENATDGMNVVANSFPLRADDEVLFTDHEYGAVVRIWQRACDAAGARLTTTAHPRDGSPSISPEAEFSIIAISTI